MLRKISSFVARRTAFAAACCVILFASQAWGQGTSASRATARSKLAGPSADERRVLAALKKSPPNARVLVLVDARLDALLETELSTYINATSKRRKFQVAKVAIEGLDDVAPTDLRGALSALHRIRPRWEGVVFVGNVKLPSFFMPRGDTPSVRLWPRYYEDLDMVAQRRIASGMVLREGKSIPAAAAKETAGADSKDFPVPEHDFDFYAQGPSPGPEIWASFLPVGRADAKLNSYESWAEQLKPFFAKAAAYYAGAVQYNNALYLVSNDIGLLERGGVAWTKWGPQRIEFYSINEKGPGAFKDKPEGYLRADLAKYPSLAAFLTYARSLPWMDEGWQSPKVFLEHMRQSRRKVVWWNVHSATEVSLIGSADAAAMENGGLIALLNGCSVGGFAQPGSKSFVDTQTAPERNVLCSVVYGRSAFLAASGSPHNRVNDEHGKALFAVLFGGGYLGQARLAQLRDQDASADSPELLKQYQEMLVGDGLVDLR